MANRKTMRNHSGYPAFPNVIRAHSHIFLEAFLLASALAILSILFGFFLLELQQLLSKSQMQNVPQESPQILQPPLVDMRSSAHELLITEIDASGNVMRTILSSSLNDALADFTLFAVPQKNYHDIIYVRPILEGNIEKITVYPLTVSTGKLKASTLTLPSNNFVITDDQTAVGILMNDQLILFFLENGKQAAEITLSPEWQAYVQTSELQPILSSPNCITLPTSSLTPSNPPTLCLPN